MSAEDGQSLKSSQELQQDIKKEMQDSSVRLHPDELDQINFREYFSLILTLTKPFRIVIKDGKIFYIPIERDSEN